MAHNSSRIAPPAEAVLEKRGSRWYKRTRNGDLLLTPSELRALAFPEPEQMTEQQLLRELVRRFRWTWCGKDQLVRFNPFDLDVRALASEDAL